MGKGAGDAAYGSALLLEWCRLAKQDYSGGAADIYKCFDQLVRPLVDKMLAAAGMPSAIRTTYIKYIDTLVVRNTIAGGLGEPYTKKTGIPQGDPFSMMITALLLRPWISQMLERGVYPRVLADDLQVVAVGETTFASTGRPWMRLTFISRRWGRRYHRKSALLFPHQMWPETG